MPLAHKIRRFLFGNDGAAAVEFAMIALPFFLVIFGIIETGLKSVQQSELDSNVYEIASKISTTRFEEKDVDEFTENSLCQDYSFAILDCNKISIGVTVVNGRMINFRNQSIVGQWNVGCPDDTLIVELNYPVTHFVHSFAVADVVERSDEEFFRSRGVIRREPIVGGSDKC